MALFHFVMSTLILVLVSAILIPFVFLNFRETETQGDVFLSFRGEETRENFTSHLFKALDEARISTFIDEVGARKMRNIDSEIERAIKESKISIILFSKDYATSTYCLDELVLIMERRRTASHHVLPLFYKVSTSEVREQTGRYGEAFAEHEKQFKYEIHKVEKWRAALRNVTDIIGKVYNNGWSEAEFVEDIVKIILKDQIYIDHVAKKERKDKFWTDASHYHALASNYIGKIILFLFFLLYMSYRHEKQSIKKTYAFVATGGRDSENFSSRLCEALELRRIPIYNIPSRKITWGDRLSNIEEAINFSKMSIVVLSEDYASSRLCLDELVMIMERKRTDEEYIVIPIFKDVNRDEVQQQTGAYLNAFAQHERNVTENVVVEWRAALEEAAKAANESVVKSIVRLHQPSIEDIAEGIRKKYREERLLEYNSRNSFWSGFCDTAAKSVDNLLRYIGDRLIAALES